MSDLEKIAASVKFTCHACGKESGCSRSAGKRDRVDRLTRDANERPELQFFCEFCGAANTLGIEDLARTNIGSIISNFLR